MAADADTVDGGLAAVNSWNLARDSLSFRVTLAGFHVMRFDVI